MTESGTTATNEFDDFDRREDLLGRGVKSDSRGDVAEDFSNEIKKIITIREKDMGESL